MQYVFGVISIGNFLMFNILPELGMTEIKYREKIGIFLKFIPDILIETYM